MIGVAAAVAEGSETALPNMDPSAWVMAECGVSLLTVQRWRKGFDSKGNPVSGLTIELLEDFAAALDGLSEVCARVPVKAISKIVATPSDKDHFAASKWLADKTFPDRWGDKAHSQVSVTVEHETPTDDVSDIPDEVFQEMTDDEYAQYEALDQQVKALEAEAASLLAGIKSRLE